jgi:GMP synthase-like glutamine amidotransferase
MHIHVFQHVAFEGPGLIADWAHLNHVTLSYTRFFNGDALPNAFDFDLLVVMGGPMGVYDDVQFPYLPAEKAFIKQSLDAGKKVLGICLGAQLLANVLGVSVTQNNHKEIGWFPVQKGQDSHPFFAGFYEQPSLPIFHWHGDTFALPEGALHLFKSEATASQAFIHNNHAIGLQFHLELKKSNMDDMVLHCGNELNNALYVQSREQLFNGFDLYHHHCKTLLFGLLNRWLGM